jgi:flagellar biosynthetic protein FliS
MTVESNMYPAYAGNQANSYLAQRVATASAEDLAALLLGAAERFLTQAVAAIGRRDHTEKARLLSKTSKIMQKLLDMLNPEAEKTLVDRLHGIYTWWVKEMFEGSRHNRPEQIEAVVRQMAALRSGWEELSTRQVQQRVASPMPVEGLVG